MPVGISGNIAQVGNDGLVITDATANASDIMSGKVAYNNYGRVVGSHVDKSYGDFVYNATATVDDIMYGKTAFVDSGRITGRHTDKTYSDFVNGTTATAGDIARGKVAFINSGRVVGTNDGSSYSDFVNDATAVSSDLMSGKVAYNNNGRFVGTHRDKVYGDFVSDADAVSSDVAYGKVFYNNSGRQIGTLRSIKSVEVVFQNCYGITPWIPGGQTRTYNMTVVDIDMNDYSDSGGVNKQSYIEYQVPGEFIAIELQGKSFGYAWDGNKGRGVRVVEYDGYSSSKKLEIIWLKGDRTKLYYLYNNEYGDNLAPDRMTVYYK